MGATAAERPISYGDVIADGRTSTVYRVGNDAAVKLLKPGVPPEWAQIEATLTESARRLGVPTPEVRDVVDVDGRPGIVVGFVRGPTMWQRMLDRPADVPALVAELDHLQRGIHAAGVSDGVPSLVARMSSKLAAVTELTSDERADAQRLLESLPVGAALLHGDLHPGNILLGPDGPVAIDWFDASIGHPAADVARTSLLLRGRGATDLRHLPGSSPEFAQRVCDAYVSLARSRGACDTIDDWFRLRAAGRLAERTDDDVTGLVETWRSRGSVAGDDGSQVVDDPR